MNWKQIEAEWDQDPEFRRSFEQEYPYESVARAIARLRAEHGLTQEQLARRVGTSQSVIARAEGGRHGVNTNLLNRIAEAMGATWEPVFVPAEIEAPTAQGVRLTYSDFEWAFEGVLTYASTGAAIRPATIVQPASAWSTRGKITTLIRSEPADKSERDESALAAGNRQSTLALAG